MTLVYINFPLSEEALQSLKNKFLSFQLEFCLAPQSDEKKSFLLKKAEIYFGIEPEIEMLDAMPRLKWLHLSSAYVGNYKLRLVCNERNLIITHSRTQEGKNLAEYVLTLSNFFLKNLQFLWEGGELKPFSLEGRRFLQVGLGAVGAEIVHLARNYGYKVWGIKGLEAAFHPDCNKTFGLCQLPSLVSSCDVICCALTKDKHASALFNKALLYKIKKGAVLIFLNNCELIDVGDLKPFLDEGYFRAVVFDSLQGSLQTLKGIKGLYLTPGIGAEPIQAHGRASDIFQRYLYHFLYGNFNHLTTLR